MTSNKPVNLHTGLQHAIDLYHAGRLRDAITFLQKLGKRFPESPMLWGYLGFLNREADRPIAAARCFRNAVDLSPKSERASLGLFYTLWRLKRFDAALMEMGRFVLITEPKAYISLFRGASSGATAWALPKVRTGGIKVPLEQLHGISEEDESMRSRRRK